MLPFAINLGTYGAVRIRKDKKVRLYSANYKEKGIVELDIRNVSIENDDSWEKYPKAVIKAVLDEGYKAGNGFDIYYKGNIPTSSGLSSSASIEVLTAYVLKDLWHLDLDLKKLSLICQKSENVYIGVKCGIMDQFVIANGKKGNALYLNTDKLNYEYVPLDLKDCCILIMNTNKPRNLVESKYNERLSECQNALKQIGSIEYLTQLEKEPALEDYTLTKRVRHVITENIRTKEAVTALKNGNLIELGVLMTKSHNSLKNDYEVSGKELDSLVEAALECEDVLGARMTGAGFGGCAIALVKEEKAETIIESIKEKYIKDTGYKVTVYITGIGDGVRKLN